MGCAGVLLAVLLVRWAVEAGLPLPVCTVREVTGFPCPGCGSTRAVLALTMGDFGGAWRLNPLATVVATGSIVAFCGWLADNLIGTTILPAVERAGRRIWSLTLLAGAIAANWVYLLLGANN